MNQSKNIRRVILLGGAIAHMAWPISLPGQTGVSDWVNPFWGSVRGNVVPGPSTPFGMVKLSPDALPPYPTSGYVQEGPLAGFSHTHTSGTGGAPRYGNILVKPMIGARQRYSGEGLLRQEERASAGRYDALLVQDNGKIQVELSATHKTGIHAYIFQPYDPAADSLATICIDISHTLTRDPATGTRCTGARAEIREDRIILISASFIGGWGAPAPYTLFAAIRFNRPFSRAGVWGRDSLFAEKRMGQDSILGVFAEFPLHPAPAVQLQVALSYHSPAQAIHNLVEQESWNMEEVSRQNRAQWERYLQCVQVSGGEPEQRTMLYSALRNTLLMPTDVRAETETWQTERPCFWDYYAIWDTYRTVMPLHSLLFPEKQGEILQSLLQVYQDSAWLPDAWIAGHYATIQGGTNADVALTDAIVKGLPGIDFSLAYEAMLKNATQQSDTPTVKGRFLGDYLKYGYVTSTTYKSAVSRTLEYAFNDFCIAQVAGRLGDAVMQQTLLQRSRRVFESFYDSAGYFWARDTLGRWMPDFTLQSKLRNSWDDPYFYEGGAEAYSYYVPHDMQGLINRHGGVRDFVRRLDAFFEEGRFHLHNEPLFLVPYAYHYAGMPWKTAQRVHHLLHTQFKNTHDGLPGQDDSGALSAWYFWSSIGLFPVAGQDVYLIHPPQFDRVTLHPVGGQPFTVETRHRTLQRRYIRRAVLNGKPLKRSWIQHAQISGGGKLTLVMARRAGSWGTGHLPPSFTLNHTKL